MKQLFHSVALISEKCIGCTKCMMNCPVEAIRVKGGKAVIYNEKCIDCGECIKVCPYGAHISIKNSLDDIQRYKKKIAIPSVTLYSQFGKNVEPDVINEGLLKLGFDEVFDITFSCDIASETLKKDLERVEKPAISTLCPTVVRLVETEYPSLVGHLVKMLTPIEISALIIREKYKEMGYKNEDVGIFFLTPCPSWVTKISEISKNENIRINGAIPISDIYPKLLKHIKGRADDKNSFISRTGLMWAYSGGQCEAIGIENSISVDGIKNVIKVLNDVENGRLDDIDYIEAMACPNGCLGGLLLVENPYNAERITKNLNSKIDFTYKIHDFSDIESKLVSDEESSEHRDTQKISTNFESAVKMIKSMNKIINMLPGTDCGLCGSPSCKAFAEDVAKGLASLKDCKFLNEGGFNNEG
ncbi:[Fe-Fe] hydrogenase large subunit C-terminal domain-containing protein [Caloramator proteoclasticus]|uniref:Iron only hydrogenase large subunit, C-terminal domain n=1 Tax=Caloramator proteoclasticus DSM 10124 TaxID=1121262 RepID=A0A1M4XSQ2_9CLOT|nr:[Fe-Fe] hydrogenase large subunit C-terminal domain-containing protein [Caloramator proteoclasticus]SHE96587.1 Iron only hydrogenase large subunit, C-terminal domain [Caloramator proteoclasticus DSM 10124]